MKLYGPTTQEIETTKKTTYKFFLLIVKSTNQFIKPQGPMV